LRGVVLHAPGDVRVEDRPEPRIEQPTDAVIRLVAACVATRAGGHVGYVGVTHDVALPGGELFFSGVHLHGGPAPVRRFLPELIELICNRAIDPGKVFDLELPLDEAAEGYRAMDERRAIKTLLRP
jgi:threonine dehydrogenase-like Zn-dependent dehydrogenase